MSDDIRREDVLEALEAFAKREESLNADARQLDYAAQMARRLAQERALGVRAAADEAIRALPPSPRAAAAQRLAEIETARLDAIEGVNDGSFLPMTEDGFEAWMEWFDMLDAAKTEALAAWRKGENQRQEQQHG